MSCRHFFCWLFLFSIWTIGFSAHAQIAATNDSLVLTNAAQVRALTQAEAAKQLSIRFRGVVIEKNRDGAFTLIDDSAGVYVFDPAGTARVIGRGDLVELEGVTDPGKFAPHVDARSLRKLGAGVVPQAQLADPDDLFSGRLDAQWIEVSGIVRRVEPVWGGLNLEVSVVPGGGRVLAFASGFGLTAAVDSTIQIHAVCYYQFNKARQMLGPYLSIPQGEPIRVIKPALTNLDAMPVRSVESLMQFSVAQDGSHRVRVRGLVTYSQPNAGLWLRDAEQRGLRVLCEVKKSLPVGTEIDVFGFLKRGEYGPLLEDAIIRETGKLLPASPTVLTNAAKALEYDADLIECEAVVQEQWRALDDIRLKLRDGATDFQSVLHVKNDKEPPLSLVPGTRVRVTGVCTVGFRVEATTPGVLEPQFFQILLRSPADIQVLQWPSWWTAEHVGWLTAGVMGLLMATGGGIFLKHRRRMARRIAIMKAQTALTEERIRIARDLHDEIGAGITYIGWLGGLMVENALPEKARMQSFKIVEQTHQLIESLDEIVWAINPRNDTLHSLAQYLTRYAHECFGGTPIECRLDIPAGLPEVELSSEIRHNLFLVIKEAFQNIMKHSGASQVSFALTLADSVLIVRIEDNGNGLSAAAKTSGRQGQGKENSRLRMEGLGGTYLCEDASGSGTQITLSLKLNCSNSQRNTPDCSNS